MRVASRSQAYAVDSERNARTCRIWQGEEGLEFGVKDVCRENDCVSVNTQMLVHREIAAEANLVFSLNKICACTTLSQVRNALEMMMMTRGNIDLMSLEDFVTDLNNIPKRFKLCDPNRLASLRQPTGSPTGFGMILQWVVGQGSPLVQTVELLSLIWR